MEITQASSQKKAQHHKDPPWKELAPTHQPATPFGEFRVIPLLTIGQIIGDKKATPPIDGLIPMSRSKFYAGIKTGIHPKPLKSGRSSRWRADEVQTWLESLGVND